MKVILTEKVKSLGNVGEIVNVSEGYARNFLIPQNLGILASESNKKIVANAEKRLAKKVAEQKAEAEAVASKLKGLTLTLVKKVGGNGKLFGSVTSSHLSDELAKHDIVVERRLLILEQPIKAIGTFNVKAKLFTGVEVDFQVKIEMDPAQLEEMKKREAAAAKKKAAKAAEPKAEAEATADAEGEATENTEA